MKCYSLIRIVDVSGVSGTGKVAEIVEFESGRVAVAWCTPNSPKSIGIYNSLKDAEAIHCHSGSSKIVWLGDL